MFGLSRNRRDAAFAPQAVPAARDLPVAPPDDGRALAPHVELLQRWMSLADMQQRVIQALATEITQTSEFVETESDSLSQRFQRLALNAQHQTGRIDSLTNLAMGIDVEGKTVRIDEVAELFEGTLSEVVAKILLLSKDSMSMVYALDTLDASVRNVGKCNTSIDTINSNLNMLALNARIEGERAGSAGAAFRVVANEVYELSKTTKTLAGTMKLELKTMTDGIMTSHDTLKRVATVDLTDNILVKERLETLLQSLVRRNDELEAVVSDAVKESNAITSDVEGMVTGIQFQDRTKQRLEHVVDTLHVIGQALEDIKCRTTEAVPGITDGFVPDAGWVKELLSRYTMSDMRERFVAQILDGKPSAWGEDTGAPDGASASGSMELF